MSVSHRCTQHVTFVEIHTDIQVASHVCKELVIYDVPPHNPFRDLIPLTREHPTLFHVIVANSALRISNALQRPILTRPSSLPLLQSPTSNESSCIPVSSMHVSSEYKDALSSKQIALRLLRQALENRQSIDLDIVLASVLLFIEFELIDSGKNDWRLHMNGARTLIDSLPSSYDMDPSSMSPMRICLVSNCLVYVCLHIMILTAKCCRLTGRLNWVRYEILGSTLACLTPSSTSDTSSTQLVPALEYAEANNYLSCPATLLQLTLAATELLRPMSNHSTVNSTAMTIPPAQQVFLLLQTAQSFDASIWATSLQKVSPQKDVGKRAHIASAHKAAVCIYLSRALLSFSQAARISDGLESLVSDVVHHLSFIPNGNELFKSTSWPTFIAGAETKDLAHQEWAVTRLHKVWGVCPWGYIRSAIEILDLIWEERNGAADNGNASMNWVQELRSLKVNWLIA